MNRAGVKCRRAPACALPGGRAVLVRSHRAWALSCVDRSAMEACMNETSGLVMVMRHEFNSGRSGSP